jgi:hypothetical protein
MRKDEISSIFDQASSIQRFALGDAKRWSTIGLFTQEGARHIWEGADHLLFFVDFVVTRIDVDVTPFSSINIWQTHPP